MVAESCCQFMDKPLGDDEVRVRLSAQPYIVSAEKAGQLIQQSQLMASYSHHNPPFAFKSGRGGRVQFRLVAELPYDLTPEDRALIVQNSCDYLGGLDTRAGEDGGHQSVGLMSLAVFPSLHALPPPRNSHLPIVASHRPTTFP